MNLIDVLKLIKTGTFRTVLTNEKLRAPDEGPLLEKSNLFVSFR